MTQAQVIDFILHLEKMRLEALDFDFSDEIDDEFQELLGRIVENEYPRIFDEEFPNELFNEKN